MFVFKDNLFGLRDQELMLRFLNFWVILGFVFFIGIWIIQAIQIRFLKKDVTDLEGMVRELKSKLYDFGKHSETNINPTIDRPPLEKPE